MTENNILDFARALENPKDINQEISQTIGHLKEVITSQYSNKLRETLEYEKTQLGTTQSKEASLINAITLFASEEQKPTLNRVSNIITTIQTFTALKDKLNSVTLDPNKMYLASSNETSQLISESTANQTKLLLLLALSDIL